jgi:polar amino acid transport system substrate-binding protein
MDGGDRHGIVGDVLVEAAHRAGFEVKFVFQPWRRAQTEAAAGDTVLILPLSRIPEREEKFTWIAPVFELERAFATIGAPIDSLAQAKAEQKVVLVGMGSAQEAFLESAGIDKAHRVTQVVGRNEVAMLLAGQVDAWFNSTAETLWKWKASGSRTRPTIGRPVSSDTSYIACSRHCQPEVRDSLTRAVSAMRLEGEIGRIVERYLGP